MTISEFRGEGKWLSNFWRCEIVYEGHTYSTTEHAYQAAKTTVDAERQEIQDADTPGKARRLGQRVTIRPDWDDVKVNVMYDVVRYKFLNHPDLAARLIATGDHHLIEDTSGWNDRFWGVANGYGQNHLGRILMDVREELKKMLQDE